MPVLGPETIIVVQPPPAPNTALSAPTAPGITVVTQPGPPGPQGPPGSGGATYTQSMAAQVWTVNTNLGRNPYSVLVNVGGAAVITDITFVNGNQFQVTFANPQTGSVSYT